MGGGIRNSQDGGAARPLRAWGEGGGVRSDSPTTVLGPGRLVVSRVKIERSGIGSQLAAGGK